MKLKNISELNGFIAAVDNCKGQVWLESTDGDKSAEGENPENVEPINVEE